MVYLRLGCNFAENRGFFSLEKLVNSAWFLFVAMQITRNLRGYRDVRCRHWKLLYCQSRVCFDNVLELGDYEIRKARTRHTVNDKIVCFA